MAKHKGKHTKVVGGTKSSHMKKGRKKSHKKGRRHKR
jgi:hypothetical protein